MLAAARPLFDARGPDVPLDEIARAAGVANATLYRHFAGRADLLVAVYAEEVAGLDALAANLSREVDPGRALTAWLRAFVEHVATKRALALALPDDEATGRGALFADWHAAMRSAAASLLARAQGAGDVRRDVDVDDLLAVAAGIALTGVAPDRLDTLLGLVRDGYRTGGRSDSPLR